MGTNEPLFAYWKKHPDLTERFAKAMGAFQKAPGFELSYLINNFDWEGQGDGMVVDIGGSHGPVSVALASEFPRLRFVVQDGAETIAGGPAQIPPVLADRIRFMEHDFFEEQPVKGGDIYLFRWIFHDWSDQEAIKILRSTVPALKPGARVLINDACLPKPGEVHLYTEGQAR